MIVNTYYHGKEFTIVRVESFSAMVTSLQVGTPSPVISTEARYERSGEIWSVSVMRLMCAGRRRLYLRTAGGSTHGEGPASIFLHCAIGSSDRACQV